MTTHATLLDQLRTMTIVVADTGQLSAITELKPIEATTNPSLITAAAQQSENHTLIQACIETAKTHHHETNALIDASIDLLTVRIGTLISTQIPGRVSTEIDARLSHDTKATLTKARHIIALYKAEGISKDRILIKIAATWQGIQAAKILEQEGIACNLTLLFNLPQAIACAEAGVTLISPFVGRILDWYKNAYPQTDYQIHNDPGVESVKRIYAYYKQHSYHTQIMGASFRSAQQVLALSGCDLLTISPTLLHELNTQYGVLEANIARDLPVNLPPQTVPLTEDTFNDLLAGDPMANELLSKGIDGFIKAQQVLSDFIRTRFLS